MSTVTLDLVARRAVDRPAALPAPVEYGAAVDRYLAQAGLGTGSRRVYRISLTTWAWPLVGRQAPVGAARRGTRPPIVPLAALDDPDSARKLADALASRAATTDRHTVNRELSALRSAAGWWRDQDWIRTDPTAGLRHLPGARAEQAPLSPAQASALFRATISLREHAFWRILRDSGASAEDVLRLDVGALDLPRHRGRLAPAAGPSGRHAPRDVGPPGLGEDAAGATTWICWSPAATELLRWLTMGRTDGPVFLTDRRAPAGAESAHVCPLTGRARMSYRRAAEIFTAATRPMDPAGSGWTLRQLRRPGRDAAADACPAG